MLQTLTDGSSHRLWRDHIRHQKRWLIFAVLCMVAFSAITAGQAFLVKPALDEACASCGREARGHRQEAVIQRTRSGDIEVQHAVEPPAERGPALQEVARASRRELKIVLHGARTL